MPFFPLHQLAVQTFPCNSIISVRYVFFTYSIYCVPLLLRHYVMFTFNGKYCHYTKYVDYLEKRCTCMIKDNVIVYPSALTVHTVVMHFFHALDFIGIKATIV